MLHALYYIKDVMNYMFDFLCRCEICFKRYSEIETTQCEECQRYWCNECQPTQFNLVHVYVPEKEKRVYICRWCIREKREIITG